MARFRLALTAAIVGLATLAPLASASPTYTLLTNAATPNDGSKAADVTWSPNSTYVAMVAASTLHIYTHTSSTLTELSFPSVAINGTGGAVAWSPDGQYLAVGSSSAPFLYVYYVNGATFTKLADPATLPTALVQSLAWDPTSTKLVTGHSNSGTSTAFPFLYTLTGSGASTTLTKQTDPPTCQNGGQLALSWSSDGTHVAMGTDNGNNKFLCAWSVSGNTFTLLTQAATSPTDQCNAVAFDPSGTYIATACATDGARVYNIVGTTITLVTTPPTQDATSGTGCSIQTHYNGASWSPDGLHLTIGDCTTLIQTWTRSGTTYTKETAPTAATKAVGHIAWSPDANFIALTYNPSATSQPSLGWYGVTGVVLTPGAPGTPTVLPAPTVDPSAGCIGLNWTTGSGATGYSLFRNLDDMSQGTASPMNASNYVYDGHVDGTSTSKCGFTGGQTKHYRIVPTNSFGEGTVSGDGFGTVQAANGTALSVNGNATTLILTWTAGAAATGYDVWQRNTSTTTPIIPINGSGTYTYAGHVDGTSYIATGLAPSTTLCFRVEGTNTAGEGDVSAGTCGTNNAFPGTLTLTSSPTDSVHATLSWAYAVAGGVQTGYNITRTGDCGTVYLTNLTSLLVGLCTGNSTFSIHAWNAAGNGPESNAITLRITPQSFGSDNSPLFGGNVTTYASSLGVSVDAVKFSYAGAIILILAGAGAFAISRFSGDTGHVLIGASAGGLTGLGITIAFGWIPLWATLLLLAAITLTIILKMRGGGN